MRRAESTRDAGDLQRHIASGEPQITLDKIGKVAVLLRDKLRHGPPELRQAYAQLVMDEVSVSDEEIRISGSKSVLARCAAANEMPSRACGSLFCSGVARPRGFEPVTSAFGGKRHDGPTQRVSTTAPLNERAVRAEIPPNDSDRAGTGLAYLHDDPAPEPGGSYMVATPKIKNTRPLITS